MYKVRPIRRADLDQLYALAKLTKAGLTTLPCDKKLLKARIEESLRGFAKRTDRPKGEVYLFVMEDTRTGKVVGTSAIVSKVGAREPYYTYEMKAAHMESKMLKVRKDIRYLQLKIVRNGPSEVGSLFLRHSARKKNCGRLLALSRYLFMAQYRQRFANKVIAELRGVINDEGRSPFWNAVGKHFFVVDFKKADLMVIKDKSFIAELIPKHPIYIPVLPLSAQAVIGQVHANTVPALMLLQSEGFDYVPEIDIFEAGPTLAARTADIRSIRKSRIARVRAVVEKIDSDVEYLIANVESYRDFCVTKDVLRIDKKGVTLTRQAAETLNLKVGQKVRFVSVR